MRTLAAAIVAIILAAERSAYAEPCPATALLDGEPALVDAATTALSARGVATRPSGECRATRARIEKRGASIVVSIEDPDGRRSERTFVDVEAATSLIESWARQDMNAALLFGWTYEPKVDKPVVTPPTTAVTRRVEPDHAPLTIHASLETSLGVDGTAWLGARAGGCRRLGRLCLGGAVRVLSSSGTSEQRGYDVLGSADLPIRVGRGAVLIPGIAAGIGRSDVRVVQGENEQNLQTYGVRGDAHVALSYAFTRHIALHIGLSFSGSLAGEIEGQNQDGMALPTAPRGFVRGDLGLRIGAP